MLDIKWIRENPQALDEALARRGMPPQANDFLNMDLKRRRGITDNQSLQGTLNDLSRQIGEAMKAKDVERADRLKAEVASLKVGQADRNRGIQMIDEDVQGMLARLPNVPADDVPFGKDEKDNHLLRENLPRAQRIVEGTHLEHFEIGERLGGMDFDAATAISGSRFVVLTGDVARLSRAIGQFMLDTHVDINGYTEVNPPLLVRDDAMFGTAQLPKFEDDQFKVGDSHWLIPTAEVALTNLVRDRLLAEEELPKRFVALTPCFRKEAGAAGRDQRGMIRQHQFEKVELVSVTTPEKSNDEHERMLASAELILRKLDIKYRVMLLCTGDMGFSSRKTYDIEVWLPGQNAFREISSCSNCGDFQARRMKARYKSAAGPALVHTLNGSGMAVGRALIAVMENYQTAAGGVAVPDVLVPYMGGRKAI